ncbi:MAG TPA: hypothetical protein VFX12_06275, partial [Vicinamibacterales bacterium]|nr:hypothetical protein [Vicinamibacterales bacterium]
AAVAPAASELDQTIPPNAVPAPGPVQAAAPAVAAAGTPPASAPVAAPAAPPVAAPRKTAPPPKTVVLRRSQVAAGSVLAIVLILALGVVGVVVLRRHAPAEAVTRAPAPAGAASAPVPAAAAPPTSTPAATPSAPVNAAPPAPGKPPPAASAANAPPAAAPVAIAPVVFRPVRLFLIDGASGHERDAAVRLTSDAVQVFDGDKTLKTIRYDAVIGLFQSHSREPRWVTPAGVAVPIAKVDGGALGFLKPSHDWVTVRTKGEFVPLRPDSDSVPRIVALLEQRTGLRVRRATSKD